MILPVDDEFRIASDKNQWIIQKAGKRKRNGKEVTEWCSESYYPTFESAVGELAQRMVRESDAVGFAEALVEVENVVTTLSRALPTQFKVTSHEGDALAPPAGSESGETRDHQTTHQPSEAR